MSSPVSSPGLAEKKISLHEPVLLDEVLYWLAIEPGGIYVDGTVGLGGHSRAILELSAPEGFLVGLEWNKESLALARKRLAEFEGRFLLLRENFANIREILERIERPLVDGLLLDLGLSSFLLEDSGRGFSFLRDEPLDMRMDERYRQTAYDLVNTLPEQQLTELIQAYGEERFARLIAKAICKIRDKREICTTRELAELIVRAVPPSARRGRRHPATRTFQALRIVVNRELENLKRFLEHAPDCLRPKGRLVIISFHSLEDRLVKQAFRNDPRLRMLVKKPITPTQKEVQRNPRARSAKLRVAERL